MNDEIIRAILAEMNARLLSIKPETRRDDEAAILMLSGTLATFTAEPSKEIFNRITG